MQEAAATTAPTPPGILVIPDSGEALLTVHTVAAVLALTANTVWEKVRTDPSFPQPVRDGPRYTRFRLSDVRAYLARLSAGVPKVPPATLAMLARNTNTALGTGAPQ